MLAISRYKCAASACVRGCEIQAVQVVWLAPSLLWHIVLPSPALLILGDPVPSTQRSQFLIMNYGPKTQALACHYR